MEPVVSQIEELYAGNLEIRRVNLFDEPGVAEEFSIRVVPTLILVDAEGNLLERHEGFQSLEQLQLMFEKHGIEQKEGC